MTGDLFVIFIFIVIDVVVVIVVVVVVVVVAVVGLRAPTAIRLLLRHDDSFVTKYDR
jgi:hypothetical protein